MKSVEALIDEAAAICKTKRALASRLGLSEQNLQGVYKGRRHLTAEQAAWLADILGKDAAQVWAVVTINREQDPAARARLSEAFFRRAILGASICLGTLAATAPENAEAKPSHLLTTYTMSLVAVMLARAALRRLRAALCVRWIAAYH